MKTFERMAAQGDFVIIRVDNIPRNLEEITPEMGKHIIAHSETGHNHVMEATRVTAFKDKKVASADLFELFLKVEVPTEIEHLRDFDTHESILVQPGLYKVRRQREYTPAGLRRAAD